MMQIKLKPEDYRYINTPRNEWTYYAGVPILVLVVIICLVLSKFFGGIVWLGLPMAVTIICLLQICFPLRCPTCGNKLRKDAEDDREWITYHFYSCLTCGYRFYAFNDKD